MSIDPTAISLYCKSGEYRALESFHIYGGDLRQCEDIGHFNLFLSFNGRSKIVSETLQRCRRWGVFVGAHWSALAVEIEASPCRVPTSNSQLPSRYRGINHHLFCNVITDYKDLSSHEYDLERVMFPFWECTKDMVKTNGHRRLKQHTTTALPFGMIASLYGRSPSKALSSLTHPLLFLLQYPSMP